MLIHGHSRKSGFSPEYRAYVAMKNRCLNPNQDRFKDYGERGITVCDRWLHGESGRTGFECFLDDLGAKPSPSHSLDRRENEKGYFPANCRWATAQEQARNTRASRHVDIFGEPLPLVEVVGLVGVVSYPTVRMRLHRGWSSHDAILVPKGGRPGDADKEVAF